MVCTVCHESQFARSSQTGSHPVALQCGHVFHKTCIDEWFRCAPQPSCPLCHKAHTTPYITLYIDKADIARRSSAGRISSRATVHEVNEAHTQATTYEPYANTVQMSNVGNNNPAYMPQQQHQREFRPSIETIDSNGAPIIRLGINNPTYIPPQENLHEHGQPTYEPYSNAAQTSMAGYNSQAYMPPQSNMPIQQNVTNEPKPRTQAQMKEEFDRICKGLPDFIRMYDHKINGPNPGTGMLEVLHQLNEENRLFYSDTPTRQNEMEEDPEVKEQRELLERYKVEHLRNNRSRRY